MLLLIATLLLSTCKKDHSRIISVQSQTIENISATGAEAKATITDIGESGISSHGWCWATSKNPTIEDDQIDLGSKNKTGDFTTNLSGLNPGTSYYLRPYAAAGGQTVYGEQLNFSTVVIKMPSLSTNAISNITETRATSGGQVTDDGGATVTARGVCWSISSNPTTTNSHTSDGTGTGTFTSSLTGLTSNTTYYVRAYATNSQGTAYGEQMTFIAGNNGCTDYDGNTYQTITIGSQEWMAENLKVTHYANGTVIPLVTDNTAWANLGNNNTDKAYCYYNNSDANKDTYGALYTYAAATNGDNDGTTQGVCPTGWHLPGDAEWTELTDYIGGTSVAGGKMKETGTTHWNSPNTGATNESGFTALPGGRRDSSNGAFSNVGYYGYWWSAPLE